MSPIKRKKTNFIVLSIKKNILPIIFCLFTISLILFTKTNLNATKSGLLLWANNVVPSLFPFFVATELLGYTNVVSGLGKLLNKIMRPIFNVPGIGSFPLLMGIISGYPVGAKIVTKFRQNNECTKEEAERLIAFTNNSGPLFIIGTVGISLFGDTNTGFVLFITHLFACLSVGFLFRFWKKGHGDGPFVPPNSKTQNTSLSQNKNGNFGQKGRPHVPTLGEMLNNSIKSAINTLMIIGGFVILFSVIISILNESHVLELLSNMISPIFSLLHIDAEFIKPIFTGLVELTNGVKEVTSIPMKTISNNIIICAFLLGFGGISILLQVYSIISKTDISIKPYILGKLLHGTLSAFYTYLILYNIPILNLDLQPVFSPILYSITSPICIGIFHPSIIAVAILFILLFLFFRNAKKEKC